MLDFGQHDKPDELVESMIRAAGRSVRASDDLRPRLLEAGRQWQSDRQAQYRLGGFVIAFLALFVVGSILVQVATSMRSKLASPSAAEIERRALVHSASAGIGPEWGLTEAFNELRQEQRQRLGRGRK